MEEKSAIAKEEGCLKHSGIDRSRNQRQKGEISGLHLGKRIKTARSKGRVVKGRN